MSAIARKSTQDVEPAFRWRDRDGGFHDPSGMETRHLFHTVSMIWNHVMPPEAATHDFQRYSFSPFYTEDYMRSAVRAMLPELLGRDDLTAAWRHRIDFMRGWMLSQEGIEIVAIQSPRKAIQRGAS